VAYNGAILHELYFENLAAQANRPTPELQLAIDDSFGSIDKWSADMRAALVSAPGWVLLCRSRRDGTLRNALIEEHHRGLLAEQDILLSIDGWEHAYMIDFGINKLDYIKTIEPLLDWDAASRRFIVFRSTGVQEPAAA
jgi:Fe-Mn family superoxide dismutase